ncbi:MAG: CvpA family protein [Chitinophagaceae bacterium]
MIIDIAFLIIIIYAIFKGLSKGFIIAIFSILAFIIGIAAALKLSAVVANYLGNNTKITSGWLPVLSFILIFILVVILVRLGAKFIEKTFQVVMLGWLNRLAGAVFYILLLTIIFSVFLFYAEALSLVSPKTIASSVTYSYVQPWGPKVIDNLGRIIPFFKDIFDDLGNFFGTLASKQS